MGWFDDLEKKTADRDLEREYAIHGAVLAIDSCDKTSNFIYGLMESQQSDRQRRKAAMRLAKEILSEAGFSIWDGENPQPIASSIYVSYLERKGNGGVRPCTPVDEFIDSLVSQEIECDFKTAVVLLFIAGKKGQAALPEIITRFKYGTFDQEFLRGCLPASELAELPKKVDATPKIDPSQVLIPDDDDEPEPTVKELLEDYREQDFYQTQKRDFEEIVKTYPEYLADADFSCREQAEKDLAGAQAALADWDAYLLKEIMHDQEEERARKEARKGMTLQDLIDEEQERADWREQRAKEQGRMGEKEFYRILEEAGIGHMQGSAMTQMHGAHEVALEVLRRQGKVPPATPKQEVQLAQCREELETNLRGMKSLRDSAIKSGNVESAATCNRSVATMENALMILDAKRGAA